ncbi:uncharacterized protein Triagg1_5465 [Trichoderma aggressivum f. europaeum]|uniref:Uncharacterized protein n=1 Tax=Trichoderma aggressivum f. europaeum TaxID=173218 RepID=A0AAE1M4X3_9HYPO|nr:hypothetical protein Triagg1_5465 [Trichoderma aggressivum f. europaeum]
MSMFRAKKLDLGCFVKARTIRDHTKRKVFEEHEAESPSIRDPQYDFAAPNPSHGPAAAVADALLHPAHADSQPLYNGRPGAWCAESVQDDQSASSSG